jgi:protease I
MADLTGKRIAVLAAKGVEQVELEEPRKAVEGDIHPSATFPVDALVGDASPDDFDGLLLPVAWSTPTPCARTTTRWPS